MSSEEDAMADAAEPLRMRKKRWAAASGSLVIPSTSLTCHSKPKSIGALVAELCSIEFGRWQKFRARTSLLMTLEYSKEAPQDPFGSCML